MKVRKATDSDMSRIVELGKEFFSQTEFSKHFDYSPENTKMVLAGMLEQKQCVIFVVTTDSDEVVGTTGAALFPLWMTGETTGSELFWYVTPEHRKSRAGKLLFEALEAWAKDAGAKCFAMMSLSGQHEKRVGQMYESKGYTPTERSYMKVF